MKLIIIYILFMLNNLALAETGLTFTGRYEYNPNDELLGDIVCFYPDAATAKRLPRSETDHRSAWFCFDNIAQSKKMLNISSQHSTSQCGITGTATVFVSQYKVFEEETDGYDSAFLQSVKNNSHIKPLPCNTQTSEVKPIVLPFFKENESYTSIRIKMIEAGWKPFHAENAGTCLKGDERCENRPEMEDCAGTGLGNCRFLWEKDGVKTGICTIGDDAKFDGVCN